MIVVLVAACLLALPEGWGVIVTPLGLACLATLGSLWLVFRGHRRLVTCCFWVPAILSNALFAGFCVSPEVYFLGTVLILWLIFIMPTVAIFGNAWTMLATRKGVVSRGFIVATWLTVISLTVMPLATVWTLWPLHLAFHTVRASLERLADQVAVGQALGFPRWAGPFRVARSAVDPVSGNVGLMIDPNPNGPAGLVRVRPGNPPDRRGPFGWDDLHVDLGSGWEYREED
jgi:hypothetical protein